MALLTLSEAATRLGTTERHLRDLWSRREIPAIKIGRLIRFDPADLDKYIESHRIEATR
jgi:excisionase family DNA binding protein